MKYLAALVLGVIAPAILAQSPVADDPKDPAMPDGLKALKHPDAMVRYRAAALLVRLGPVGKIAVPQLRETLKDENGFVRVKAAEALWAIEKTSPTVLLSVLLKALTDRDPRLRAAAAPVLGKMGGKARRAVPALVAVLRDDDETVRLEAIAALGEIGPAAKDAAPALLRLIRDEDSILEPFVVSALGNLGTDVVPVLASALSERLVHRRRVAAEALSMIGANAASAQASLTTGLADSDPAVRLYCARTLGLMGPNAKKSAPSLQKALKDSVITVRLEAGLALWRIEKSARHIHVTVQALGDSSVSVSTRLDACRALGFMGPDAREAVPGLLICLCNKESALRQHAAEALGLIGPAADMSADLLRELLKKDPDPTVRLAAALAAWRVTGQVEASLTVLRSGLNDKDRATRRYAASLLKDMGQAAKEARGDLIECLADEDAGVRAAAKDALNEIDARAGKKR